jgi:hypothetical protein
MATNNETLERSTSTAGILQFEEGTHPKPEKRTFTPDQKRILGEAYRLILSWQPRPVVPMGDNAGQHSIPNLANVEVEA